MIPPKLKSEFLVYIHPELEEQLQLAEFRQHKPKVDWVLRQFILEGRTTQIKSTASFHYPWRRALINGCHYYLWWLPGKHLENNPEEKRIQKFYFRAIRHHDNLTELDPKNHKNYVLQKLKDLDPCYPEQREVIEKVKFNLDQYQLDTIQGDPGSGKTVALEYAAHYLAEIHDEIQEIQYITYTRGLKDRADKFFQEANISHKVKTFTFNKFIGCNNQTHSYSFKQFQKAIEQYLNSSIARTSLRQKGLGGWEHHLEILWIEIRAYIYGLSLPFSWQRGNIEIPASDIGILALETYFNIRQDAGIDKADLEIAHVIAKDFQKDDDIYSRIFPDLCQARKELNRIIDQQKIINKQKINQDKSVEVIIIDEVQDLTILQIAVILEKGVLYKDPKNPFTFRFILAGDESQTICPSGFHWNFTKNLFTSRLESKLLSPSEKQFPNNYRNPDCIAQIVQQTYSLYKKYTFNKDIIPSGSVPRENSSENTIEGEIILWDIANYSLNTNSFLNDLEEKYLTDCAVIHLAKDKIQKEIVYSELEIKGLERKIIFILGLSHKIKKLGEKNVKQKSILGLRNRKIIDTIRVAVSRSTQILVLVSDQPDYITQEFPLLKPNQQSWEEIKNILSRKIESKDIVEELNSLLQRIDECLRANDLDRSEFFFRKFQDYKESDIRDFKEVIAIQEEKIMQLNLELIGESLNQNNSGDLRKYIVSAREKIAEQKDFQKYVPEIDKYEYESFIYLLERNIYKIQNKDIKSIDQKDLHQNQKTLEKAQKIHEKVKFQDSKIAILKINIEWIESLHSIGIGNYQEESELNICKKLPCIDLHSNFLKEIYKKNSALLDKIAQRLWSDVKKYLDSKTLYQDQVAVNNCIRLLKNIRSIGYQKNPESVKLWCSLIDAYEQFYPLLKSPHNTKNLLEYIDEFNVQEITTDKQAKVNLEKIITLWLRDIKDLVSSQSANKETLEDLFIVDNISLLESINQKYPEASIKINSDILENLRKTLPTESILKLLTVSSLLDGVKKIKTLDDFNFSFNTLKKIIMDDSFRRLFSEEKKYCLSEIQKLQDLISDDQTET